MELKTLLQDQGSTWVEMLLNSHDSTTTLKLDPQETLNRLVNPPRPRQHPMIVPNDMAGIVEDVLFNATPYSLVNPNRRMVALPMNNGRRWPVGTIRPRLLALMEKQGLKPLSMRVYATARNQYMEAVPK